MNGRIIFENPNEPEQPTPGVYRWFVRRGTAEVTVYVGRSGMRGRTVGTPSTLKRGIQEAQRSCVTSDKGKHLDTDFVVGTALALLTARGFDCLWQHVDPDPANEAAVCERLKPLLQTRGTRIDAALRLKKPGRGANWSGHDIAEAHALLAAPLTKHFLRAAL